MKPTIAARPPKPGAVTIRFVLQDQRGKISPPVSELEFSGKAGATVYFREERVIYTGLGERARLDANRFRAAAGTAAMALRKIGQTEVSLHLEDWPMHAGAALEGVLLADYRFDRFKEKKSPGFKELHVQVLAEDVAEVKRDCRRSNTIAAAVNYARGIANLPGNLLYPAELARLAVQLAGEKGLRVTVLDEKKLQARGFGGLIAVGSGSARPPRLIILEYSAGGKKDAPLAFVGKAITFDSGGISIKPAANMEEMIFDKCGGIAVLGAMAAVADLRIPRNIVGIIASAENMPGARAYRPGDIVRAYDGQQIEVINTDAEGRVVLADALAYAREDCAARAIIDLATLTGACGVALGEYAAGLWSNSDAFEAAVKAAADAAGERVWSMPLFPEHEKQIQSDVAGVKNSGGRLGGACTAAAFLKAFVKETPWAHLDIAFTAHREKDQSQQARGATGFGIRTLVEMAERGFTA